MRAFMMLDKQAIERLLQAKKDSGQPFSDAEAYLHLCYKLDSNVSNGVCNTTARQLAEVWGWYHCKVQRFLRRLAKDELIELVKGDSHTIVQWGKNDPHGAPGMRRKRAKMRPDNPGIN